MMDVVEVQCPTAGCGHSPFPVAETFHERAQRTHEVFHCPAGHELLFPGESEVEKLEKEVRRLTQVLGWTRETRDDMADLARQCPWPTCRGHVYFDRSGMYRHMERAHGMPRLAEVKEAS